MGTNKIKHQLLSSCFIAVSEDSGRKFLHCKFSRVCEQVRGTRAAFKKDLIVSKFALHQSGLNCGTLEVNSMTWFRFKFHLSKSLLNLIELRVLLLIRFCVEISLALWVEWFAKKLWEIEEWNVLKALSFFQEAFKLSCELFLSENYASNDKKLLHSSSFSVSHQKLFMLLNFLSEHFIFKKLFLSFQVSSKTYFNFHQKDWKLKIFSRFQFFSFSRKNFHKTFIFKRKLFTWKVATLIWLFR